jgi:hypothetical protein
VRFSVQKMGDIPAGGVTHSNSLVSFSVNDSLEFLHQSAFAKLSIIHVRFASAIPESHGFPVYVCEWICVLLIVHDISPLTRILLLVRSLYGEFKILVDGDTIIDGGATAFLGVLPSGGGSSRR